MKSEPESTIDQLRARLTEVDRTIIETIAERQAVVAAIGARKLAQGLPLRDFTREKEVLDDVRERASSLALDPGVAEEVLSTLIRASLQQQEQARVTATAGGTGRRALVIGGAGRMGRWFAEFLLAQGYAVDISDPAGPVAGYGFLDPSAWSDTERDRSEATSSLDYDVLVVAASLAASARVLARLAELRPSGLIFDIGSLKSPLRTELAALAGAGCRITSIHPMFGPDTRLLSGRHVLFCDAGVPGATAAARALFASTSVEQIEMALDEHDRLIAFVLGLSHALNIAFFTALAESGKAAPVLRRMSSTTFDAQLRIAARVATESPHLYYEIQALNDFGGEALDALESAVARVTGSVRSRDEAAFARLMDAGRRYMESGSGS